MKKVYIAYAVAAASAVLTLFYWTGLSTKLLMELVVLGALAINMAGKAEKLRETPRKAMAVNATHLAAMAVLWGCFLRKAGAL